MESLHSYITVTQQTHITVRHLSHFTEPVKWLWQQQSIYYYYMSIVDYVMIRISKRLSDNIHKTESFASLWLSEVTERKKREAYFSLRKLPATILGLAEVTATICAQGTHPSTCFFAPFITILILFLGIASVGSSHPTLPCCLVFRFWFLSFNLHCI